MRGRVLADRFELDREAGAGGMASVWRAHDLATGRTCAVKLLIGCTDTAALRFDMEAGLLADLRHPGIVRHIAHGRDIDGTPFLAMEWLEGEDLALRLSRGPLALEEAIEVVQSAAEALEAAHARGIVHRDVKPSNLFLPARGATRVKVLDFGIARRLGAGGIRLTAAGTAMGTPAYMAPEQARAADTVDGRADVFALGCVLFECVAGRPAFSADDHFAVLAKILLEQAPRLSDVCSVPRALDELCVAMMSKEPAERPATVSLVARALAAIDRDATLSVPREPRRGSAGLSGQELRVACVVLASPPREVVETSTDVLGSTTVVPDVVAGHEQLRATLERIGARLEVLGDGSLVVTIARAGSGSDLAAMAAQSALAVRKILPGATVVLAAGRTELSAGVPVGEAIDRAARLLRAQRTKRAEIEPGGVAVDDVVAGMLDGRFEVVRQSGSSSSSGWLIAEHPIARTARTLLGKATRFVGRESELDSLERAFDDCARTQRAGAMVVIAPAGAGKSRLRHELLVRLARRPRTPRVLLARTDVLSADAPYALLASALRAEAAIGQDSPIEQRRARLVSHVRQSLERAAWTGGYQPEAESIVAFVGEAIGVPFADDDDVQLRAARRDPMLMGDRVRGALSALFASACAAGPVLLVLEDLHWGDAPSVELIDSLLSEPTSAPLMVLALARPEIHERYPQLWKGREVATLELGPLPSAACGVLVRQVLGDSISWRGAGEIVERAQGNAFFLEELIRASAEGRGDRLPESVLATIEARLDALEADARRALRAASIFGRTFWEEGVGALLVDVDAAATHTLIDALVARELIGAHGTSRFAERRELSFRHALLHDAVYATLTDEDREMGHRLAARWLEDGGEVNQLVLAEHWERGADAASARGAYYAAAQQALAANDFASVLSIVDRAVPCGASGEELGRFRLVGAEAAGWRGDTATQERWGEEAMALLPHESPQWFRASVEAATGCFRRGNEQLHATILSRVCSARLGAGGLDEIRAYARVARTAVLGGFEQVSAALLDRVDELAEILGAGDLEVGAAVLNARTLRSIAAWDPAGTIESNRRLVEILERIGDVRTANFVRGDLGFGLLLLGAYEEAEATLRTLLAAAQRMRLGNVAGTTRVVLGLTVAQLGRVAEGRALVEAACEHFDLTASSRSSLQARTTLASVLLLEGDLDAAERAARALEDHAHGGPAVQAHAAAILTQVLLAQGRIDEALEASARGIELRGGRTGPDDDPLVLLARVEALLASGDLALAKESLGAARDDIERRAAKIEDPVYRESFRRRARVPARILELAEEWLGPAGD